MTSESTTITFFTPESTADTNGLVDFQVEMTNGACARARKHRALAWLWGSEIDGFPTLHGQPNRCFDDARCAPPDIAFLTTRVASPAGAAGRHEWQVVAPANPTCFRTSVTRRYLLLIELREREPRELRELLKSSLRAERA